MNFKLMNILVVIFSLILLAFIIFISWNLINIYPHDNLDKNYEKDLVVKSVIDGDTIELYNGEIIRLICIDTPEEGTGGFEEARLFLESLVLNKEVKLESDVDDKDKYNRSLRYVYVEINGNEIFVNKELVKYGLAKAYRYGNDTKKCDEIEE